MELIKKNIHMDRIRTEAVSQITLEEDVNIPDNKQDVNVINLEKARVVLEEIRSGTDAVTVRGSLVYDILYHTTEEGCNLVTLSGSIPFEEKINLQGATAMDTVAVTGEAEDFHVSIINSRKLSLQALLTLHAMVEELYDEEVPIGIYGAETAEYRQIPLTPAQLAICKKDIFRMKEEISLPAHYPNIFQILWSTLSLGDMEFKVQEEKLSLQGEIHLFVLYEGEGEEHPIRSLETTLPLRGSLECHGCREGMFADIRYTPGQQELSIRPDLDGEERNLGLELGLDMTIRMYEEEPLEVLSDIYGVTKEIGTVTHTASLQKLLSKVTGKTRVTDHVRITDNKLPILQVLHSEGSVALDHQSIVENGILLQGGLLVKVMYITGDDETPYVSMQAVIPYQYTIEVPDIRQGDIGRIHAEIEQLQVNMLDGEELDVKAVLSFTTTVLRNIPLELIREVTVSDIDTAVLGNLPSMVIYMVREGDNLWNIGKKYYVPVDTLRKLNGLGSEELKPGQKILVVKGSAGDTTG